VDPCSKHLKRQLLDRWMRENCDPPTTRSVVGVGEWEKHRFHGRGEKPGLYRRMRERGWEFEAPLIDHRPAMSRADIYSWLDREFIDPPALSEEGFDTNNCGGFCVKMGHKQAKRLYYSRRSRYDWHAGQEQLSQQHIGTTSTVLADRTGGKKVPLSLVQMAERIENNDECSLFSQPACGCFYGEDDE